MNTSDPKSVKINYHISYSEIEEGGIDLDSFSRFCLVYSDDQTTWHYRFKDEKNAFLFALRFQK